MMETHNSHWKKNNWLNNYISKAHKVANIKIMKLRNNNEILFFLL